jgi:hypothetical protein
MRPVRLATCPYCQHQGVIPRAAPTTAFLRCRACGARSQIRHCIGPRPCRPRRPNGEGAMRAEAAREILRQVGDPKLDDRLDDLFRAGTGDDPP